MTEHTTRRRVLLVGLGTTTASAYDALRARYARPDEKLVLLAGRLVYEKGFQVALDALPRVIRRVGNVRFLVAGTGTQIRVVQSNRNGMMTIQVR